MSIDKHEQVDFIAFGFKSISEDNDDCCIPFCGDLINRKLSTVVCGGIIAVYSFTNYTDDRYHCRYHSHVLLL